MCPSPNLHLKELEKNEYPKLSANRRKEMMKIRAEIKQRTERQSRINKTKSWFFVGFKFYLFVFERDSMGRGGAERERQNPKEALCCQDRAQSGGSNSRNRKIMT